jgi:hypothetical protein
MDDLKQKMLNSQFTPGPLDEFIGFNIPSCEKDAVKKLSKSLGFKSVSSFMLSCLRVTVKELEKI